MKTKTALTALAALGLILLLTVVALKQTQPVKAQDQTQPPPIPERISFGTIGITSGQTLRVSAANTIMPNDPNLPPGPIRVVMTFRYMNGNLVRDFKTGDVIRKAVDLERGDSAFLDLDYDQLPPGPIRTQVRPVVVVVPPPTNDFPNPVPPDGTVIGAEVINNANGRTQLAVFTHPSVQKVQPPPVGD